MSTPPTGGSASTGPAAATSAPAPAGLSASSSAFVQSGAKPSMIKLDAIEKLTGAANWKAWASVIRQFLRVNKSLGLIDGSTPQPASTDPDYDDWATTDASVTLVFLITKINI